MPIHNLQLPSMFYSFLQFLGYLTAFICIFAGVLYGLLCLWG